MQTIIYPRVDDMIWDKRVFQHKPATEADIATSFKEVGQLQPIIVIAPEDEFSPHKLVIGRHRYGAAKKNYKDDPSYVHMFLGKPCPPGTIAALDLSSIPAEVLLNMEIAENVHRMTLSWQERTEALANLHTIERKRWEARQARGEIPMDQTYSISATAKKLAGITGGSEAAIRAKVSTALIVAEQLSDPTVAKAESARAAFNVVRQKLTMEHRKATANTNAPTPHTFIFGDCRKVLMDLPHNHFSMILADPPYGIGADTYENMKPHEYDDSWENAVAIYNAICGQGFNVCKEDANLFLCCTPERWHEVRDIAVAAGWTPWFRPLIWVKSTEGMRPWGAKGLAYTYETIMWATKGNRGLIQTALDVFNIYRPSAAEREHAAAKPVALYERLLRIGALPGDFILDPCVGSGTSFKAGTLVNMPVTGIENNHSTAEIAQKNMFWDGKEEPIEPIKPGADSLDDL